MTQTIHRLNTIPIKMPMAFITELEQIILKTLKALKKNLEKLIGITFPVLFFPLKGQCCSKGRDWFIQPA